MADKNKKIEIEWPQYGKKVTATLAVSDNPELCEYVWKHLPFECVQEHGMVTGDIIYCWTPLVNVEPVHVQNLHTESPMGRISYSQGTGNKIIIKYGWCSEDLNAPVLGIVDEDGIEDLKWVGREIWHNTMHEKEIIKVIFKKKE
jgi:hypothetical protein